jgi:hypothetical protein
MMDCAMPFDRREDTAKWLSALAPFPAIALAIYLFKHGWSRGHTVLVSGTVLLLIMAIGLLIQPATTSRTIGWGFWLLMAIGIGIFWSLNS